MDFHLLCEENCGLQQRRPRLMRLYPILKRFWGGGLETSLITR
jgi:hypothetical protein